MDRFVVLCSNYAFKSLSQKILKYYYSSAHITLCAFNVSYLVDYKKGATNNILDKKVKYWIWYWIVLTTIDLFSLLWNIRCSMSIIFVHGSQPKIFSLMLPRYDGVKFLKL